jgi:hypothetical protein
MTTLEIEIAILKHLDVRQNIVVNGVHWGMFLGGRYMHECDLLSLSKAGYATEIEIKISKYDLLKDKKKPHQHKHNHIKYLYFAVPEKLKEIALNEIPDRAGLFVIKAVKNNVVHVEKKAKANPYSLSWTDKEKAQLMRLGVMRILTLKSQLLKQIKQINSD